MKNMQDKVINMNKALWLALLALGCPVVLSAQIHERGIMRKRANVELESSRYTIGIVPDTNILEYSLEELTEESLNIDNAAESEDEILYAGFDNDAIHYPKFDYANMEESIFIPLVNASRKQFYVHPVNNIVTSHFGPRRRRYHYGTDVDLVTGDPVRCAFDGKVRIARYNRSYGNLVVVRHNNGLETYYAHLSQLQVKDNQEVKAGDILGLGGNTGRSRGSHLHFEIRYLGAAINPEYVIDFNNYRLKSDTLELTRNSFRYQRPSRSNIQYVQKTSQSSSKYYTVRKGDTLGKIARNHGTTVKKLAQLNGIKGTRINAGQRLRLR